MSASPTIAPASTVSPLRLETAPNGVCTLTLARPVGAQRALARGARRAAAALDSIEADKNVRAVVLAAEGPVFSSGHDLKEITAARKHADGGRAFFEDTLARCAAMMQAIVALPQPVIAAVEGVATAAGCQLVATCDLAIAGEKAQFCTPGVNIGLFCSTPMVALSRNLSRKHAMEMLLTGDMVGRGGRRPVRPGQPRGSRRRALERGARSGGADRVEIRAHREDRQARLLRAGGDGARRRLRPREPRDAENLLAQDAPKGVSAILEKRPPNWQDR